MIEKTISLSDFYRLKFGDLPSEIIARIGQFNVFELEDVAAGKAKMPYSRKDYFKISLISGSNRVHYADKTFDAEQNMLLFANPQVPYNWDLSPDDRKSGFYCVFTEEFFKGYGNIRSYPMFQPGGTPIISITDEEFEQVKTIYGKMFAEIESEYVFKYDVLRNLVMELVHTAMKLRPALITPADTGGAHAAERITGLFLELLERQFPIESPMQRIKLHTPGEFAAHLNVHSNHLNKVLKETTGKTTSRLLAERLALEARALLKHTDWSVADIGWCLGFEDPSHFVKFFRKNEQTTPRAFRG
ncbi:helix-turn-helix domain-containing protein [Chitinophaga sp. GCM10012297]|uniref:Helix-turn-helix transcriptional regulator n=1 Tax=Chitinophaga chungangae TaxID=2821488 RepID=A0ABS3YA84_9BACT|nr:AraC family transcriptional regulator [Chitinophaga chungangae]MBO9151541.1 helix-turn-helix transcriptional regulator [Chitinophaga chungangae]